MKERWKRCAVIYMVTSRECKNNRIMTLKTQMMSQRSMMKMIVLPIPLKLRMLFRVIKLIRCSLRVWISHVWICQWRDLAKASTCSAPGKSQPKSSKTSSSLELVKTTWALTSSLKNMEWSRLRSLLIKWMLALLIKRMILLQIHGTKLKLLKIIKMMRFS